mmetsp:Transcript_2830/g.8459  ORF Transcript_2830/g.8459 Transcript_2830/m.8459 type:complete len:1154 (-) Transcript_2830:1358-4819(-)
MVRETSEAAAAAAAAAVPPANAGKTEGESRATQPGTSGAAASGAAASGVGEGAAGDGNGLPVVTAVEIKVQLPDKGKEPLVLSLLSTDCVQDMRQYVSDEPVACTNTCFFFEHSGTRLNDMTEIGGIEGLESGDTIHVRNDEYNERALNIHLRQLRGLLRAMSGVETDAIPLSGEQCPPVYLPHVLDQKFGKVGVAEVGLKTIFASPLPADGGEAAAAAGPAVRDVSMSAWNPPPGPRSLKGDLSYIRVEAFNGTVGHFVAHSRGFYLSRTTDDEFNPSEKGDNPCRSHTLSGAIGLFCETFRNRLAAHFKTQLERSPLESLPVPYIVTPWMCSQLPHTADNVRAEDAAARWSEADPLNPGMIRDWNDELQTLRDLEIQTEADRLIRDRALYKLHTDYVAAATRGAQAAVLGNIPPVNPIDSPESHMFVWNNMFLSFASNARGIFTEHGGEEAAHAAASNDLRGVRAISAVHNSGLYLLATVVVDYLGRRVVAQSIIPGILRKNHQNTIVYGTNDVEKKMVIDPTFSAALQACAPALFVDEHKVKYLDGEVHTLHSSAECKGIAGVDGRYYVLDLIRTTPIDTNFADPDFLEESDAKARGGPVTISKASKAALKDVPEWKPRHKLCVLRYELLVCYREHLMVERAAALKAAAGEDEKVAKVEEIDIRFNLDAFTHVELADTPDKIASDREAVKAAGDFLLQKVVPHFVNELQTQQVRPLDGEALTVLMHERGINMRYLGIILSQLKYGNGNWHIVLLELLSRAAKFHLRKTLQGARRAHVAVTVSHFLNCLVGEVSSPIGRKKGKNKDRKQLFSSTLTSERLWDHIVATCRTNFFCNIDANIFETASVDPIALVRSLCKKTGMQLLARDYSFSEAHNCFRADDILHIVPTVKHSPPECERGIALFSDGRRRLQMGQVRQALSSLEAAIQEMQQVFGLLHPMIADVYRHQAYVLSHATQSPGMPIGYQEKVVIILERVLGRDHPDVIRAYVALGQYLQAAGKDALGLAALSYARQLCLVAVGAVHPELPTIDMRVAMCFLAMGVPDTAMTFLDALLATQKAMEGDTAVPVAQTSLLRAKALRQLGDMRGALSAAREAHGVFSSRFGDSDIRTRECYAQVNRLTAEAVQKERAKTSRKPKVNVEGQKQSKTAQVA